jgi:diguanylate cyclase (GGDEF)-like protein
LVKKPQDDDPVKTLPAARIEVLRIASHCASGQFDPCPAVDISKRLASAMASGTRLNLGDFPDSPHAHELRRGVSSRPFDAELELQYLRTHVERARLGVRVWFTVAIAVSPFFILGVLMRNVPWNAQTLIQSFVTVPCTAVLAWLSWSRHYARWYMPVSRVLVPLYAVSLAVLTAQTVAQGQLQEVAGLTLNLIGVFFFSGLLFREAFVTSTVMFAAFTAVVYFSPLQADVALKCELWLALTVVFGGVVRRDVDRAYRQTFLEDALIGELVTRDGLSGLMNRRAFDEHLARVWQHAVRDRRPLAVLMIDIDHFKHYNDNHGHQAGDVALRKVAQAAQTFARRPLDLAARYGGEEFAVILYDLSMQHVQDTAERLRRAVEDLRIEHASPGNGTVVTVSVGVGYVEPRIDRTPQGAIQLADEALYEAKRAARNCVVVKGRDDYDQLTTGSFRVPQERRRAG